MNETKLTALNCSSFAGGKEKEKKQQARLQKMNIFLCFEVAHHRNDVSCLPQHTSGNMFSVEAFKRKECFFFLKLHARVVFFFLKCTWTQEGWILNGFSFLRIYICWDGERRATRRGRWWNTEENRCVAPPRLWNNQCSGFDRAILQWENESLQRFPLHDRSSPLAMIHTWCLLTNWDAVVMTRYARGNGSSWGNSRAGAEIDRFQGRLAPRDRRGSGPTVAPLLVGAGSCRSSSTAAAGRSSTRSVGAWGACEKPADKRKR